MRFMFIKSVSLVCLLQLPQIHAQQCTDAVDSEQDGLVYATFPQADLANTSFATMVLRMADKRESLELPQLQQKADDSFAGGNFTAAMRHYLRMAYYGDKFAHLRIGLMHLEGKPGIAKDVPRGMAWLALAMEESEARHQISSFYRQQWQGMTPTQRCRAQQILDKLVLRYSNLALMENLHDYYDHYFSNRGGTNLKAAQSRVSASGVAASGLGGGYNSLISAPNDEFILRREFAFVETMLSELGSVTLGDLQLLEDEQRAPEASH